MTLLAVREFFDIPVLIGDTLVSSIAPGKHHFPTQPPTRLLDSASTYYGLVPINTYRKVYIISDNFAIGWAGDTQRAANLLERIFSTFAGRAVTLEAWEEFITSQQPDAKTNVLLAGWIVETGRRLAFRWRSKLPLDLEKGAYFYEGSGADFARRTFTEPEAYITTATEDRHKATLCALDCISTLIAYELRDGSNLRKLFGLCYELILLDGNKFSYINDINYLHYYYTWHADRPDSMEGGIVRFRIHYRNFDNYACCTISNHTFDPHIDGFLVIKPVFGEKAKADWAPTKRLRQGFDAEYFCNFVFVEASDGKNMNSPFVVSRGSPYLPIEYEDQGNETYVRMKEGHDFILKKYLSYRAQLK